MAEKPTYEELERRVQELEKAEYEASAQRDRAEHLRNILLAIRNVHQLITRETDPKALVKKACSELTDTRGYFNAWIALMDEKAGKSIEKKGGLEDYEIMGEEISEEGNSATVEVKYIYGDGSVETQNMDFLLEDGEWLLEMNK